MTSRLLGSIVLTRLIVTGSHHLDRWRGF